MKKIILTISAILFVSTMTAAVAAKEYNWKEGKNHIGEEATVCGKIIDQSAASDVDGEVVVVGLGAALADQESFGLEFKTEDVDKFQFLKGNDEVCVTGKIKENPRGTGSMRLTDVSQVKVNK